jgi:hypothetical protein
MRIGRLSDEKFLGAVVAIIYVGGSDNKVPTLIPQCDTRTMRAKRTVRHGNENGKSDVRYVHG